MTSTPPPTCDPLRELASGVDALYLSVHGTARPEVVERLEEIRQLAGKIGQPLPAVVDDDLTVMVAPHGFGRYRYNLGLPHVRVGLTTSRHLPTLRLQPRSEYLHGAGPAVAAEELERLAERFVVDPSMSVSRLDLYADWQGWSLDAGDRDHFVSRADHARTYTAGSELTGFDFGTRTSHSLVARIYDKTVDIARTGNTWWHVIWGDRYRDGQPVHRVEFEFARPVLKEFGLTSPAEVLAAKADLWAYAADQWLTHRCPTSDQTRSRWPVSPQWAQVQHASLRQDPTGVERLRAAKTAGSVRKLLPPLTGYLASYAALVGTVDIDDTLRSLREPLRDYETISRTTFCERVAARRARLAS